MFRFAAPFALVLGLLAPVSASAQEAAAELTREEIEAIVRDYLIEHPEVVIEALRAWEQKQAAVEQESAQQALADRAAELYDDPETPFAGNPDGDVVIVEFFDYRCGYCRHSATDLFALLESDPDVKVVFKEFPILGEASVLAARAAVASRAQGLYTEFHMALMEAEIAFSEDEIMRVAESVGLDTARLKADMAAPEVDAYLARTDELARALGVNGTPAFVVNDMLIPGALDADDFEQIVTSAREG